MAPTSLRRLTTLQNSRLTEIELISNRLRERTRSSINLVMVHSRIEAINEIWNDARNTHSEIIIRDDAEDDVYVTDGIFARLHAAYDDALHFLQTLQSDLETADLSTINPNSISDGSIRDFGPPAAKLPKLDLPKFSGRYEDWENFCDLFTTLVHDVPRLADATKLQYLKSCLTDTAADLVKDVSTTNANYTSTWQALKARFHNPRLIVYNLFRALKDIPHIKKESAVEIRSLSDESQRIVRALTNLKMPVEHWDIGLVFVLASRLDPESRKAWETQLSKKDREVTLNSNGDSTDENVLDRFPKMKELTEFLEDRAQTLNMITLETSGTDKRSTVPLKPTVGSRKVFHTSADGKPKCPLCTGPHRLYKCYRFKAKNGADRRTEIRRLKLCFNCFGKHRVADCTTSYRCETCKEKHHSMIHFDKAQTVTSRSQVTESKPPVAGKSSDGDEKPLNVKAHTASILSREYSVLLATAQLTIIGPNGMQTRARALLDQGSEATFVSDAIANLLGLPKRRVEISLSGLGASSAGTARAATRLTLQSMTNSALQFETDALILQKITSQLPSRRAVALDLQMFADLPLADPQFHVPDSVDIILGADIYGQLLRPGLKKFPSVSLIAQDTALGWIISGPICADGSRRAVPRAQTSLHAFHCATEENLDETLQQFWKLEEFPPINDLNAHEDACEKLFKDTHTHDSSGRFVVRLPLKSEPPALAAESRRIAVGSLNHSYRRFNRDAKLAENYREFMKTYEELGHMERVPTSEINNPRAWYLPHHPVVQSSPDKWKLRVVFDASREVRKNQSLNNFLLPGPALQRDLSLILLNWRRYRFVFTADIVKMFRQIRVAREDQDLQRIVWAASPSEPPVDYRLTTVTYGTSCAPYLAIRTLMQIAEDHVSRFPLGAQCLKSLTYVDDTFAGADDLTVAVNMRQELVAILRTAGIELDKWAANHPDLLPSCASQSKTGETRVISADEAVKTLGIQWNPNADEFRFTTLDFKTLAGASTKRAVLSNIARLFDPLGWLAPITVNAKILMQDLWISKCGWDDTLPAEVRERWFEYCNSLTVLPDLSINRWIGDSVDSTIQIHGFSDASSRAYAATVYIRMQDKEGNFRVSLLAAKSKVAPVKTVSIPNLELCGAVLLVKLLKHVRKLDFLQNLPIFAWSDSQIVLTWLRKHPCNWKTFVANRVSFIQTELPSATWSHVPTKENPADMATRGCKPFELMHANLWWHGPDWLAMPEEQWPKAATAPQVHHAKVTHNESDILTRFSSLSRLIRVVAYCRRPLINLQRRRNNMEPLPKFLTTMELSGARAAVIRLSQAHSFAFEIETLKKEKTLPKRNVLTSLNPFVDKADGILRVGGRLSNSTLSHNRKHPPLLSRESSLSRLIVRYAHRACMHGGPTLTSNIVMQFAWILGRNRLVKTEVHNCITCQRVKPRFAHQMMGNLPSSRVTPARPFSSAGLDYAGPFQIRTTKGRGYKSYKGYIALFICFTTRAIHLEAVSDLTTKTFLSAYKRFAGRRGICQHLYSDNATTFQSADKELRAMFKAGSDFYKDVAEQLANDGTAWTFIPPTSPHYGGLWEAGVKSVKHHLKRAIGEKMLTFEEFSTVLVEIEACVNSRPICPLNSTTEDLQVLTPAHFLIGEASGLLPDEPVPDVPENRLERFHILQAIRNNFWKRWSNEYLQQLQERAKWREPTDNFAVGQLVLLRDDRYPPSKWPLGRVTEVHLGSDGLVRVATVRTATSTLRRHIARLCPLSVEQNKSKPIASDKQS